MSEVTESPVAPSQESESAPEPAPSSGIGQPVESAPPFEPTPEVFQSMVGSLPEEIRNTALIQETKDFESLVGQAINAQKLLGRKTIEEPQEDWSDEKWDELYTKLGRPEDAKDYGDAEALQEKYKEILNDTPLEGSEIEGWNDVFHKAGLSSRQAEILQQAYLNDRMGIIAESKESLSKEIHEQTAALRQQWGDEYTVNLNIANQAYDKLAPDSLKDFIDQNPAFANNEGLLNLFHTLGREMGNARGRTGGSTSTFAPNSPAAADAELTRLQDTYKDLIYPKGGVNALTPAERTQRDKILQKQHELYKLRYPEEN